MTTAEKIIELVKELNLTDLTALVDVLNTRRYRMRELEEKKFSALLSIK